MEKRFAVSGLYVKQENGGTRTFLQTCTVVASSKEEAKGLALDFFTEEAQGSQGDGFRLAGNLLVEGPFYRTEDVDKLLEEQKPDCLPGEPAVIDTDQKIEVKMIRGDGFISPVSDCSRGYPVKVIEGKEYVYADAVRYANQSIANAVYWLQKLRAWGNSEIVQKIYKLVHPEWFNGPNTPKTTNLSFSEALEAMKAGKTTKQESHWRTCRLNGMGEITAYNPHGICIDTFNKGHIPISMIANDWQICEDNA